MGGADETGLVRRGWEINPIGQTGLKDFLECIGVRVQCLFEIPHRALGKEKTEHRADLRDLQGNSLFLGCLPDSPGKHGTEFLETFVGRVFLEHPERCNPRSHGERVAAQGACLVDRAKRGQAIHDLGLSTKGTDRQTASDDLAHRSQVRRHARSFLYAPDA